MHLRSVHLINWRSYRRARFEFPRPHGGKNVVLVMAPNEVRQNLLFRGAHARLVWPGRLSPRPSGASRGGQRRPGAHQRQLQRVSRTHPASPCGGHRPTRVCREARMGGRNGRADRNQADLVFQRQRSTQERRRSASDLRRPTQGPRLSALIVEDKDGWYREWIAQHFLQPTLAEFFLFDGEQYSVMPAVAWTPRCVEALKVCLDCPFSAASRALWRGMHRTGVPVQPHRPTPL